MSFWVFKVQRCIMQVRWTKSKLLISIFRDFVYKNCKNRFVIEWIMQNIIWWRFWGTVIMCCAHKDKEQTCGMACQAMLRRPRRCRCSRTGWRHTCSAAATKLFEFYDISFLSYYLPSRTVVFAKANSLSLSNSRLSIDQSILICKIKAWMNRFMSAVFYKSLTMNRPTV